MWLRNPIVFCKDHKANSLKRGWLPKPNVNSNSVVSGVVTKGLAKAVPQASTLGTTVLYPDAFSV